MILTHLVFFDFWTGASVAAAAASKEEICVEAFHAHANICEASFARIGIHERGYFTTLPVVEETASIT